MEIREWSYEQRLRQYHADKSDWIKKHPDATAEEVDNFIRYISKKYRV